MEREQHSGALSGSGEDIAKSTAREADLRLALIRGVGPRLQQTLREHFGSAEAALRATVPALREVPGVGPQLSQVIASANREIDVHALWQLCREHDIGLLFRDSPTYPRMLQHIHDPPPILFMHGALRETDNLAVAIVGTRHASQYGLRQATLLSAALARAGMTIVSGLARGIDAAAHRAALGVGGRTVAVLGGGLLRIYPPEHRPLATAIRGQGALLCESHPHTRPQAGLFPQRNRVITGMSAGVVVIEATERSGALISARHAMEQGRDVFAVPGPVDSRTSRGCHGLLRDGATLVESADDILEQLGPLVKSVAGQDGNDVVWPSELVLNEQERQVLQHIEPHGTSIDELVSASQIPVHRVLATISALEMRHLIRRLSGQRVARST